MKALVLKNKNKWREMQIEEVITPDPGNGEVLVEVQAVGLNPVDYKTGTNGNPAWSYPHILGLDVAGTIAGVGEDVQGWKVGDPVVYHGDLRRSGGYSEFDVADADILSRIPSGVSFAEAAALPTAGYTAYQAVHRKLPLDRVNSLLIHAGAGGVGGFAVQLAKMAGKTVYTTASEHNHEYVRSLGADGVIDYRQEDVHTKIMEWTEGRGVDAVIDTVSRDNATASLDSIAYMGHIVYIAGAPDFTKVKPFTSVVSYHEVALAANHKAGREARKDLGMMGDAMLRFVADKKLSPMLKDTVAMEEVPAALERLSERHVNGKLVAVWK